MKKKKKKGGGGEQELEKKTEEEVNKKKTGLRKPIINCFYKLHSGEIVPYFLITLDTVISNWRSHDVADMRSSA